MSKNNVPQLRLKGFEEEWSRAPAGDIFTSIDDRGHPDLPVLSATQTDGMIPRELADYNIHHDRDNEVTYKRVQEGDFVVHLRSFQGGFAHSYYEGITSPAYHVFRARQQEEQDDEFWRYVFASPKFIHLLTLVTYGIRDGQSISFPEFLELAISHPSKPEQQAIASIFTTLDTVIKQHETKHHKLQQAKTALMQKMFPAEGQTEPELRLEGFEGEWSLDRLGNFTSSASGGTPTASNKSLYGGQIPFIRSAEIDADDTELYLTEAGVSGSSARMVSPGTILYALYGATSGQVSRAKIKGAINQAVLAIYPHCGYDPDYLVAWLNTKKKSITDFYLQGGQGNLSGALVKNLAVQLPPTLPEQQAIGAVFTKLDALINSKAQLVTKLKQAKTALMQKMFV